MDWKLYNSFWPRGCIFVHFFERSMCPLQMFVECLDEMLSRLWRCFTFYLASLAEEYIGQNGDLWELSPPSKIFAFLCSWIYVVSQIKTPRSPDLSEFCSSWLKMTYDLTTVFIENRDTRVIPKVMRKESFLTKHFMFIKRYSISVFYVPKKGVVSH